MAQYKQFKSESKKVLDLMIHSIYTNQEIFLRELLSNASDAMDKLYAKKQAHPELEFDKQELKIELSINKDLRTIHIKDHGIGMTKEQLEENLGTIAHSDSGLLKETTESNPDMDLIGQFGVGFYSSFMVADEVKVMTKSFESPQGYVFTSQVDTGYKIDKLDKQDRGTEVILMLKPSTPQEETDQYLSIDKIKELVKKYSDYIRYPIVMMNQDGEEEILNSMIPLWKRSRSSLTQDQYDEFYMTHFNDYQKPLHTIHLQVEGAQSFSTLLYIPSHVPYNFYTPTYQRGLELFSRGIFIKENSEELIGDSFSFVKGIVDSADLNLNISREMLQNDRQLKAIEKRINRKLVSELESMIKNDREKYETFFNLFGLQLKYGVYQHFGANKEELQDLLLFTSSHQDKLVTLNEYLQRMKENQTDIYYVSAPTISKARQLPQVESYLDQGFEVLFLLNDIDEFVIRMLNQYQEKPFKAVNQGNYDAENEQLKEKTEQNQSWLEVIKQALSDKVSDVRLTQRLKSHPVCLVADEGISFEMEKVFAQSLDQTQHMKASRILELNPEHPLFKTLATMEHQKLKQYAQLLYDQALLIEGLPIENPAEFSKLIAELMIEAHSLT